MRPQISLHGSQINGGYMNIFELINDYQKYSEIVKSEKTCEYQRDQVSALTRYFKHAKITLVEQISKEAIDKLIQWSKKTCCNNTINKRILFLKQVFRYHHIEHSYLFMLPKLKQETRTYDIFNEEDLKTILYFVDVMDEEDPYMLTRKLIPFFLLDTGVRANEMINIKIKNINFKDDIILLERTKNSVDRFVPFTRLTKRLLQKYVSIYPKRELLFWNYKSFKPYTYRNLEAYCDYLKKKLNIPKLHPHMFRHTMATSLIEDGCPIETVQKLLGHKDISMTMIYIHMSIKKAKKDFQEHAYLNKYYRSI